MPDPVSIGVAGIALATLLQNTIGLNGVLGVGANILNLSNIMRLGMMGFAAYVGYTAISEFNSYDYNMTASGVAGEVGFGLREFATSAAGVISTAFDQFVEFLNIDLSSVQAFAMSAGGALLNNMPEILIGGAALWAVMAGSGRVGMALTAVGLPILAVSAGFFAQQLGFDVSSVYSSFTENFNANSFLPEWMHPITNFLDSTATHYIQNGISLSSLFGDVSWPEFSLPEVNFSEWVSGLGDAGIATWAGLGIAGIAAIGIAGGVGVLAPLLVSGAIALGLGAVYEFSGLGPSLLDGSTWSNLGDTIRGAFTSANLDLGGAAGREVELVSGEPVMSRDSYSPTLV